MRYFVVSDDGTKYGPADVETLQGWINEGRLLPATLLEEEASGARIAASAVQGLNFPPPPMSSQAAPSAPNANPYAAPTQTANPYAQPSAGPYAQPGPGGPRPGPFENPPGNYPRYPGGGGVYDDGQKDITTSWVLGVIGFFCCWLILSPIGMVYANKAKQKGNPGANAPLIFNVVVFVLGIIGTLLWFMGGLSFLLGTHQPIPVRPGTI